MQLNDQTYQRTIEYIGNIWERGQNLQRLLKEAIELGHHDAANHYRYTLEALGRNNPIVMITAHVNFLTTAEKLLL